MNRKPTTIYIIDDDTSVGRSLARLMRSAGFVPEVFTSVDEFIAKATFAEHACIIADVQMKGGGGLDLQQRLKEIDTSIPVILLTAVDTDDLRAEAKLGGFSALFRKPVDDQALIDAIEWALNKTA